jgi:hypothetical protein
MTSTISENELERRTERAIKATARASSITPKRGLHGMYCYADGPVVAGGGMGSFCWFRTRSAVLDYIGEHLPYLIGPSDGKPMQAQAKVKEIISRLNEGSFDDAAAMDALNVALKDYSQITWWGPVEDLFTSTNEFARDLRSRWHSEADLEDEDDEADWEESEDGTEPEWPIEMDGAESEGNEDLEGPIEMDEADDFLAWLGEPC